MEKELAIYVSASAEMDAECELLGQLLAEMTKSIRWTIKRTPSPHELANPDLEALRASQFYLILMGSDITAPIGVELQAAKEAKLFTFAFRKMSVAPSPAGAYFIHHVDLEWQPYQTPQEFVRLFERALISQLLEGTPGYGLDVRDLEELAERLRALEEAEEGQGGERRRGAGHGGVILPSRE